MGREIKRVPLDFNWPLNMVWKGYISPYRGQECRVCDGSGLNSEVKQISDDWYDFAHTGRRWCHNITQDEVYALLKAGRLAEFTEYRSCWFDKDAGHWIAWIGDEKNQVDEPVAPSADAVNRWSRDGIGHDAINRWICIRTRAQRLGVWGNDGSCNFCHGQGNIWFNETIEKLADDWYDNERYDPPLGDGWQVWETVSEGSPISPVFTTSDEMVAWLVGEGYSEEAAQKFVGVGWVMSMGMKIDSNGVDIRKDIESLTLP